MDSWRAWFKKYGRDAVNPVKLDPDCETHMNFEDLYQAFKGRMEEENPLLRFDKTGKFETGEQNE